MTDFTSGGIPLMEQSNPQRYLTYNELAWIVNVVQTGVISRSATAPPGSPAIGDAYIPAAPATDEWTDLEDKIVFWFEGVWNVLEPELAQGRGIYVQDEYLSVRWDALGSPPMYVTVALGDVSGPGSSVDGAVALFDGTDGITLKSAGTAKIVGALQLTGVITPAQITANTDDYNPTGLSAAAVLRLSTDASRNLTGIQGGAGGRELTLHNVGGFDLVLKDDTTSTAANRFQLSGDVTLGPDQSTVIQYDATASRWRVIGGQGSSGGAVTSVAGRTGAVTLTTADIGGLAALADLPFTSDTGSTADSDPGNGLFKWNHATQTSATFLYFDNQTIDAVSMTTFFALLFPGGFLHLRQADDSTKWQLWRITSVASASGYYKFGVSLVALAGSIDDDKAVACSFRSGQRVTIQVACSDETTAITTGTAKVKWRNPFAITLVGLPRASLSTASSSGNPAFDINEAGASIFSTTLTIDSGETTSVTAATPCVVSDASLADDAEMSVDFDAAGTGAAGVKITLVGYPT